MSEPHTGDVNTNFCPSVQYVIPWIIDQIYAHYFMFARYEITE